MNEISRPVLRYPGGKWKVASWIIEHFPQHEVYVEVFGGGASVLMRKAPSRTEVYNDIESRIVNVFRVLRDPIKSEELLRQLELTPFASAEYASCYAEEPRDDVDAARQMIFRSFAGVGSDSVNRNNGFRRGFKNKKLDAANIMSSYVEILPFFTDRLRDVIIENLDWRKLLIIYDSTETLFYVDPPYLAETRTSRTVRYIHEMKDQDHLDLLNQLKSLKGNVILSGYWSEMYSELLSGWQSASKIVPQAGSTTSRAEWIWIKRSENKLF